MHPFSNGHRLNDGDPGASSGERRPLPASAITTAEALSHAYRSGESVPGTPVLPGFTLPLDRIFV